MGKKEYYSNVRLDILPLLEKNGAARILEVGCGKGQTLAYLKKKGYASYVAGIEKVEKCCVDVESGIDKMINADAEDFELQFDEKFDVILFLDVLEHLYNPMALLRKAGKILKPDGYIVLSIPNIRNWSVLKRLILKGRWDYKDSGILDRTHIRFFTKKSFILSLVANAPKMEVTGYSANMENYGRILKRISWFKEFFTCQHIFKLRPRA